MLSRLKDLTWKAFRKEKDEDEEEDNYACPENCQQDLDFWIGPPSFIRYKRSLTAPSWKKISKRRTSPFFTKLPTEIRRLILIAAFGERTLHMDLSDYCNKAGHPGNRAHKHRMPRTDHTLPVVDGCGPFQHLGHAQPPSKNYDIYQWGWWSSVCHRNLPDNCRGSMGARDGQSRAPWEDHCRGGAARYCQEWGTPGWCCKVGALGFLRTCRQAYVEGLDILYGTNTFHIANSTMFPRLPQLIVPARLADIVSLEVVWGSRQLPSTLYLHVLSDHLTGLTKIFISVVKETRLPWSVDTKEDIFESLDDFVLSTPRLREVCVSVPFTSFSDDVVGAVNPTPQAVLEAKESGELFAPLHVWRPLSGEYVAVGVAKSPYPDAPVGLPTYLENKGLAGYWIVEGHSHYNVRDIHLEDPMDIG